MTPHSITPTDVAEIYDAWADYQNSRLDAFPCELHIHRTVLLESLPPGSRVLDVGTGPGRYAIELSRAGHRVVAGDISPVLVELARRNIAEAGLALEPAVETPEDGTSGKEPAGDQPFAGVERVVELDAVDLSRFPDESFDAVVSLGPFYHLQSPEDRRSAASEAARVLRPGGQLFAAFMPRAYWFSMVLRTFVTDPTAPVQQLAELERLLDDGLLGKVRSPQLKASWFCHIEEIAPLFAEHGVHQQHLVASSGVAAVWTRLDTWQKLDEREPEVRQRVLDLILRTASDPHVLGMSDHVLYIGEKSP